MRMFEQLETWMMMTAEVEWNGCKKGILSPSSLSCNIRGLLFPLPTLYCCMCTRAVFYRQLIVNESRHSCASFEKRDRQQEGRRSLDQETAKE